MDGFEDMQALLRFGHGQLKDSRFLLLQITDKARAGIWLQNTSFSSAVARQPVPDTALQIAFTVQGLNTLGLDTNILSQFSEEFLTGIAGDRNRSRRLGDTGQSAPEQWLWGNSSRTQEHLLLLLYARKGHLDSFVDLIVDAQFKQAFRIVHTLPTDTLGQREPFGFIDGISQPSIDWQQNQRTDAHGRESYSNLLAPGEVVLGYPNEYGQLTHSPSTDATDQASLLLPASSASPEQRDFGKSGSYLVLRQLEQDVQGFWRYMYEQSANDPESALRLAESMVGRRQNGEALVEPASCPIAGIPAAQAANHFNFDADPMGYQCPVGAHIRRSNPRTGDFPPGVSSVWKRLIRSLGFGSQSHNEDLVASTRFHRILRRGRTYGMPDMSKDSAIATPAHTTDDPTLQGLQFMCLTGNILRQFEFVQSAWSESASFADLRHERDPILGRRAPLHDGTPTDFFTLPDKRGAPRKLPDLPEFVTVRGGGYFFMPGLQAIKYLGAIAQTETGS